MKISVVFNSYSWFLSILRFMMFSIPAFFMYLFLLGILLNEDFEFRLEEKYIAFYFVIILLLFAFYIIPTIVYIRESKWNFMMLRVKTDYSSKQSLNFIKKIIGILRREYSVEFMVDDDNYNPENTVGDVLDDFVTADRERPIVLHLHPGKFLQSKFLVIRQNGGVVDFYFKSFHKKRMSISLWKPADMKMVKEVIASVA